MFLVPEKLTRKRNFSTSNVTLLAQSNDFKNIISESSTLGCISASLNSTGYKEFRSDMTDCVPKISNL